MPARCARVVPGGAAGRADRRRDPPVAIRPRSNERRRGGRLPAPLPYSLPKARPRDAPMPDLRAFGGPVPEEQPPAGMATGSRKRRENPTAFGGTRRHKDEKGPVGAGREKAYIKRDS